MARFLDLVAVKGKAQPVAVYELIGRPGQFGAFTPELLAVYQRGIEEYRALGCDEFIRSGFPHLEEAYEVAEGVVPLLRRSA